MSNYFPHDTYITPPETKRALMDRLLLSGRWYYFYRLLGRGNQYRPFARQGLFDTAMWARSSHDILQDTEAVGGRFHITGLDNIRHCPEAFVLISNHMSSLETFIFPGLVGSMRELTFVIKESILRNPVFRDIMKASDPIVVGRDNPREDLKTVLSEGERHLARGRVVVIFPQSTRQAEFIPEQFNSLGVKLARNAGVPVIPAAIKTDFWENGRRLKILGKIVRSRTIFMKFGEPIRVTGNGNEAHKRVIGFIQDNLGEWQEE